MEIDERVEVRFTQDGTALEASFSDSTAATIASAHEGFAGYAPVRITPNTVRFSQVYSSSSMERLKEQVRRLLVSSGYSVSMVDEPSRPVGEHGAGLHDPPGGPLTIFRYDGGGGPIGGTGAPFIYCPHT